MITLTPTLDPMLAGLAQLAQAGLDELAPSIHVEQAENGYRAVVTVENRPFVVGNFADEPTAWQRAVWHLLDLQGIPYPESQRAYGMATLRTLPPATLEQRKRILSLRSHHTVKSSIDRGTITAELRRIDRILKQAVTV